MAETEDKTADTSGSLDELKGLMVEDLKLRQKERDTKNKKDFIYWAKIFGVVITPLAFLLSGIIVTIRALDAIDSLKQELKEHEDENWHSYAGERIQHDEKLFALLEGRVKTLEAWQLQDRAEDLEFRKTQQEVEVMKSDLKHLDRSVQENGKKLDELIRIGKAGLREKNARVSHIGNSQMAVLRELVHHQGQLGKHER